MIKSFPRLAETHKPRDRIKKVLIFAGKLYKTKLVYANFKKNQLVKNYLFH